MGKISGIVFLLFVISSSKQCWAGPILGPTGTCAVQPYDLNDPIQILGPEFGTSEFDSYFGSPYNILITSAIQYRYRYIGKNKMECYNFEGNIIPVYKKNITLNGFAGTSYGYISNGYSSILDSPDMMLTCIQCKIPKLTQNITDRLPSRKKFVYLDFAASQMNEIDENALDQFVELAALNLDNNALTSLPDELFSKVKSISAMQLSLSNNNLDRMNRVFCNIKEFEFINLQNNKIRSMETECKIKVNYLNMSRNSIGNLSLSWLENYDKLNLLDLSFNNVDTITDVHQSNLDLKFLILSNNKLRNIGRRWFRRLTTLQFLSLNRNGITTIDSEAFKDLRELINLDLSHNKINDIPFGIFTDLEVLKELNLAGNNLSKLTMQTFAGLTELKYLNLSSNSLKHIVNTDLLQIKQLQAIDLSHNRLQKLDVKAILSEHSISWLSIKNNFWNCRQLLQVLQYIKDKNCNVKRGLLFNVPNIHGIACSAKNITLLDSMDFEGFLDTLSDEKEMELILSKLDSVPVDDSSNLEIIMGRIKSLVLLIAVLFVVDFIFQWLFRLYQARHTMTIPISNLK